MKGREGNSKPSKRTNKSKMWCKIRGKAENSKKRQTWKHPNQ